MTERIVNIINFIRGIDERGDFDLVTPVVKEAELIRRFGFPATWLLQYDALVTGPYVDCLKQHHAPNVEYGIWLEMDRYLVEAAGLQWKGRLTWDYHANCAFSLGYTREERRRLCDEFVAAFARVFGHPPKVMGSWCFDAFTLQYLHERHGVIGACICKDQQGTDGYTLRGGYFANAYYPSVRNAYMPAQKTTNQIPVPVFRMLGSDPLHQYDCEQEDGFQLVTSLEPVYKHAGGNSQWVDWFLKETFTRPALAMSYAQMGQENSFSADQIFPALEMQFEKVKAMRDKNLLKLETLGESASAFRSRHHLTPPTAVTTLSDWRRPESAGVWYLCRNYRLNLFQTPEGRLSVRSWNLFDENFPERNESEPLRGPSCVLETLPIWDSFAWQGAFFGIPDSHGSISAVEEVGAEELSVRWQSSKDSCTWLMSPDGIRVTFDSDGSCLTMELTDVMDAEVILLSAKEIRLKYRGWTYRIVLSAGELERRGDTVVFQPEQNLLEFHAISAL